MQKKTIRDIDIKGKRVLIRVDFNVPLGESFEVLDDTRIAKSLPTIRYCVEQGAKVILMAHLGRPKGKVVDALRLNPAAQKLEELIGMPVKKLDDCIGEAVAKNIATSKPREIILLENLRFYAEEEKNDPAFAKQLASLGDVFVNDGFGVSHRAHASTEGITHFLPSVAGLLLEREVDVLTDVMQNPKRPLVGIVGGAKISTKLGVIGKLMERVDYLLLGGALANTILKAQGIQTGKSLVEEEMLDEAKKLTVGNKLHIPIDVIVAKKAEAGTATRDVAVGKLESDDMILDIGPDTLELFGKILSTARMVVWNGPMGICEIPEFSRGTAKLAEAITKGSAKLIVGGGETVDAIRTLGFADRVYHLSTGGGAMLEFIEGKKLPGIEALENT